MFKVYQAHRQRGLAKDGKRIYPSYRTSAGRIIPPLDVAAGAEPLYDVSTDAWNGREVVQLKRFADRNYYLGKSELKYTIL